MPKDDNKIDLDRLYSLEYGAHIDRIYGNLRREIESQANELNRHKYQKPEIVKLLKKF